MGWNRGREQGISNRKHRVKGRIVTSSEGGRNQVRVDAELLLYLDDMPVVLCAMMRSSVVCAHPS